MANEVKIERTHTFAVYKNTTGADVVDKVRVDRSHSFAVYQNTNAGDLINKVRVDRAHSFAVYANEDSGGVDMVRIKRTHVFAVIRAQLAFSVSGNSLRIHNAMDAGTYPVTVRATDAHGQTIDKTFNVVVS